jgi:hypothetical protein
MRDQRDGMRWMLEDKTRAADLFFQCLVIKVVKVQVLVEWSRAFYPGEPHRLPRLVDVPIFLQCVDAVLLLTQSNSANGIIQEQCDVSENFNDKLNFRRFFKHLSATLEQWLSRLLLSLGNGSVQSDDMFQMVIGRLATFISDNDGLGSSVCGKAPFQCQHILMNLNECVLDDFPLGVPKLPVIGFGGAFGAHIGTPDHLINIFHVRHTYSQFCVGRFNGICNT